VADWYDVLGTALAFPSTVATSRTFPVLIAFRNLTYVVIMLSTFLLTLVSCLVSIVFWDEVEPDIVGSQT